MRSTMVAKLTVVALSGGLLLWACGGGGGGGGGAATAPTAEITAQSMADAVAVMDTYVPGCTGGAAVARGAQAVRPKASGIAMKALLQLIANRETLRAARSLGLEDVTAGDCPGAEGTFTDSYTHASGTDTGTLIFAAYCTVDHTTGEQTTIDGTLSYVDAGQPTPTGPERFQFTANTGSGGVRVQSGNGDDTTMNLTGLVFNVGAGVPDTLSISSLSVADNTPGGHTEQISGFSVAVSDSGTGAEIEVRGGRLTTQEHGTVDLATAVGEPLVVDGNGDLVGGTLMATGAGATAAEFIVNPASPNGFEIAVDGSPLSSSLDCTGFFGGGL